MFNRYTFQNRLFPTAVILLAGSAFGQTYSPMYAPNSSTFSAWQCVYDGTTTAVPYALFTVVPDYYSNTNAHYHNANRPNLVFNARRIIRTTAYRPIRAMQASMGCSAFIRTLRWSGRQRS